MKHVFSKLIRVILWDSLPSIYCQCAVSYTDYWQSYASILPLWTNLNRGGIRKRMRKKGIKVSVNIVRKLLKKHYLVRCKALKRTSTGSNKNRDPRFKKIAKLRSQYENSNNPIISIDAKKKELIGNLYRDEHLETTEAIEVFDHDFPHLADGKITPYAVYNLKNNESFVNIGTSCDTSDLACDSIKI